MGAHFLENVKAHIENDYLYVPGLLVHLCFYLHLEGFYPFDLCMLNKFLIDMLRLTPALLMLFLYIFLYCKVYFTLK